MTTIQDIYNYLHSIAPFHLQEPYDNAGLIVGNPSQVCTGVITCLDSTETVIEEAVAKGANLVIAHHPIIFSGLKRLTGRSYIERTVIKAIKHDVAIIAIHTNLDNVLDSGVNGRIATRLGLVDTKVLASKDPDGDHGVGSGVIGTLATPLTESAFLHLLKDKMQTGTIKHTRMLSQEVSTVAVCGGSGGFLLGEAIRAGAQVFVTADYKYHEYFDADGHLMIADIGHYESEQFTIELLQELINQKFSTFAAHCTEVNTNPVNYF